ncbi:MAG: hypothetical protein ACRDF9_09285, partial [Candidatus Limnocylindria bacterium]
HRSALGRRKLFSGTTLFLRAALLGDATIFGGALLGGAKLRGDALLFLSTRFLGHAPFIGRPDLGGLTLLFDAPRFFRALFLFDTSRLRRGALLFSGALCLRGFVRGGEDLFILDDSEDIVIFDVAYLFDGGPLVLERFLRHRSLFDVRLGLRRSVRERCCRRATVFVDELFEQAAQRIGRGGAQIGGARISRDRPTKRCDRAAALMSDIVLELIVFLAQALDLLEQHPALFTRLLEDLRGGGLGAFTDLVRRAERARERVLSGRVVLLDDGHPALGGLKIGLELRDALGELGHP